MAAASLASQKIDEASVLLEKLNELDVEGVNKLKKRIKAEINFLKKALKKGSDLKEEHVMCSNLGQLGAVFQAANQSSQVVGVLQNFSSQCLEKIVVDVVAENGKQWIKVILRCPKALHLLYVMGGRKGVKPLNEVAEDFLIMATQHPVFYTEPQVVFWFFSGVSESLASDLEGLGVSVRGTRIPDDELGVPDFTVDDSNSDNETNSDDENLDSETEFPVSHTANFYDVNDDNDVNEGVLPLVDVPSQDVVWPFVNYSSGVDTSSNVNFSESNERLIVDYCEVSEDEMPIVIGNDPAYLERRKELRKLNLDVTAMIAYVSSTTNGGANFIFADKVLTEQAMWERQKPVKQTLDEYFEDSELIVCQEALDHFTEIINTIGGPSEKERSQEFMERVRVVPGQDVYENRVKIGGKVRKLSRLIFGTSQAHKAITVTSNRGFVRSAEQQGVRPVVLYHEARALTEMKESSATPLEGN